MRGTGAGVYLPHDVLALWSDLSACEASCVTIYFVPIAADLTLFTRFARSREKNFNAKRASERQSDNYVSRTPRFFFSVVFKTDYSDFFEGFDGVQRKSTPKTVIFVEPGLRALRAQAPKLFTASKNRKKLLVSFFFFVNVVIRPTDPLWALKLRWTRVSASPVPVNPGQIFLAGSSFKFFVARSRRRATEILRQSAIEFSWA